jgi:hypothetical protein
LRVVIKGSAASAASAGKKNLNDFVKGQRKITLN